jgi:hypothetical protein
MKTYTERFKCSESFAATIPDKTEDGIYDRWHVHQKGQLAEKWLIIDKGPKSFKAEITVYMDDENV